jgi:FixJ family two-component response regulator
MRGMIRMERSKFAARTPLNDQTPRFVVAVVDDDHRVLQSIEYLLDSADYAVHLFASAAALLNSGQLSQIDCLISDIDMPDIDGIELLELVDSARPGLPAILITGYPDRLKRLPSLRGSTPPILTKPFQGNELLAAVHHALHTRSIGTH